MKIVCPNCESEFYETINYYPSKLKSLLKYFFLKFKLYGLKFILFFFIEKKIYEIEELFIFKKIFLCQNCNLGFLHPIIKQESLDRFYLKQYWNKFIDVQTDNKNENAKNSERIKYLINYSNKINLNLILEIGPGSGNFYLNFKKYITNSKDFTYYGVDLSNLSDTINDTNYKYLSNTNQITDNSIDLIIMVQSIEHFSNIEDIKKKIFNKLKKGGIIYIETPNYNEYYYKKYNKGWLPHTFFFNIKSLTEIAKKNNLKIKNIESFDISWSKYLKNSNASNDGHNIRLIFQKE